MNKKLQTTLLLTGAILLGGVLIYVQVKALTKIILSPEQEAFVRTLHPKAQKIFRKFIKDVESRGYKVIITDAYRSWAQSAIYKEQDARNATPGYSEHNYGMGLDLVLQSGGMLRKASSREDWIKTGIPDLAKKKYGMRWGGDFNGYADNVHFDLGNACPADELHDLAIQQFGNNPNKIKGNQVKISCL